MQQNTNNRKNSVIRTKYTSLVISFKKFPIVTPQVPSEC